MFCPNCGKEQVDNPKFCRNCGAKLIQSEDQLISDVKEIREPIHSEEELILKGAPLTSERFQRYIDEANRFSISYPENWVKIEGDLLGFQEKEEKGGFIHSFIVAYYSSPLTSLENYLAEVKRLNRELKNYVSISEEKLVVDGMPAIKLVYTFTEDKTAIKQMAICLVEGKVGWSLFFTGLPDTFDAYQATFNAIINSFHLLEVSQGEKAASNLLISTSNNEVEPIGRQKQMAMWLVMLLGVITLVISFFVLEQFEGFRETISYIVAAAIAGVATGILARRPGRGALAAILAVAVGYLVLIVLGYRMFKGPSEQELEVLSFWGSFVEAFFLGGIEAAFFGAIAGAVAGSIKRKDNRT